MSIPLNKKKNTRRECVICGSNDAIVLCSMEFCRLSNTIVGDDYDVVSCNTCGFVFSDVLYSQPKLDQFYADSYSYVNDGVVSSGGLSQRDIRRYEKTMCTLQSVCGKDSKIIDIGCAKGGLIRYLRDNGFIDVSGMELSSQNVKALALQDITIHPHSIAERNLPLRDQYDLLIMSNVLEHVSDVNAIMDNISLLLKRDGFLYIEVPNAEGYASCIFDAPYHFFDIEHINHFDEHSLNSLMTRYGLRNIETKSSNYEINSTLAFYPMISSMYRFDGHTQTNPQYLSEARVLVQQYISKSETLLQAKLSLIQSLQASSEPIIIWGVGAYFLHLMRVGLDKCNIQFCIDQDSHKQSKMVLSGEKSIPIHPPERLLKDHNPVLVASAVYQDEIIELLHKMGKASIYQI